MPDLLTIEGLCAGYGEAVVLVERVAVARRRPFAGAARPQRHGQDHAGQHDRRRHALFRRHDHARRPRHHQAAARPARAHRRRLGAAGAQHLQVAHRGREPHRGGAARSVDDRQDLRAVPAARRAQAQPRQPALRRRAADARGRPRAGAQSAHHAARRAARRAGADHRRGAAGGAAPHHPRRGHVRDPGGAERAENPRRHRPRHHPRARLRGPRGRQRGAARRPRHAGDPSRRHRRQARAAASRRSAPASRSRQALQVGPAGPAHMRAVRDGATASLFVVDETPCARLARAEKFRGGTQQ